jgi:hypothetical protein
MAKKDPIVKQYGGYGGFEDGSYTVFDSRTAKYGNKSNTESAIGAEKSAKVLNQLKKDAAVVKQNMGVWQGVTTAYGFNNYGQHSIEGLQKLQNLPDGSHVIVYDFETLGVAPHMKGGMNYYTPTEIGLRKAVMKGGQLQLLDDKLSILTAPVPKVGKQLQNLLSSVTGNPWVGANPDVARTLSDLVLYSGNKKTHFDENGNLISVKNQNRTELPLKGTVISSAKNTGLMKNGLDRLLSGTPPQEIAKQLNAFMQGTVNPMFVAFNNYNFDQPLGMDYFGNQLMDALKGDTVSQQYLNDFMNAFGGHQVDLLHAERTIRRNMYQRHGSSNTLENQASIFGFEQETAHHALSDAGATVQKANQMLADSQIRNYLNTGGMPGNNMGRFNATELMAGDRLFAKAGLGSSQAGEFDGVFRMNNKGEYIPINSLKPNPIYRSATYEVKRWLDGVKIDGKTQFGVELYNETDDLHHVIYRNSKAELQDVIHGHMDYLDKPTKAHAKDLETTNRDRALRRWNKMWSTESGGGDNLVRRMMGALDTAKGIESRFDEFTNEAKLVAKGHSWEEAAKIAEKNRARVQRVVNQKVMGQNEWNNEAFVRDFNTMRGRLEGEADWIKGFMNHLDGSQYGKADSNYMRRVRNQAWTEFGNTMNSMFGANESAKSLGHSTVGINLNISGNDELLRINDVDSVRGSMYSMLYRDHAGKPTLSKMKQRYRELLGELKAKNALAAKEFEYYYRQFDKVKYDPKNASYPIDNLLNDLANTVMKARETNSLNGAVKSIKTEDPTRVMGTSVSGRKRKMERNLSHADEVFSHIMQRVTPFATHWEADSKTPIPLRGKALDVIEAHKQGIQDMLNRNGILGKDIQLNTKTLSDPTLGLKNLAKSYMDQGMHVKIVHDGKRDALSLVLADRETPASALDGSLKDIMKGRYKHQVAVIPLPKITKDSQLQLGGQNRVARFIATRENGGYGIQTGYDEILRTLSVNAGYARRILNDAKAMGESTGILQMESILNSRGKGAMQNLSMNYRNMNPNDVEQMFNIRSSAANWVRGGAIDVSAVAEDWYEQHYNKTDKERRKLWGMKSPEDVRKKAQGNYELFVNTMDINSRRVFQREVDQFWNDRTGMDVGMHSIKDTHASNYLRAANDIRELYGFGFDNPMARENMQKTVNYLSLDKSRVTANLLKAGFKPEDIERMTKMGVTTDRAKEVFEDYQPGSDKMSFMNLRTAYMDDSTLKARVDAARDSFEAKAATASNAAERKKFQGYADMLKNPEALSVYDGMFLMSNEASQAFETPRSKTIKISADAVLTPEMKRAMEIGVPGQVDWSKSFELNTSITMNDVLKRQTNNNPNASGSSVTVSQIVKQDLIWDAENEEYAKKKNGEYRVHTTRTADAIYDKWHMQDSRIVSWNVDEEGNRSITLEEMSRPMQGTKFNTTSGGRLTANQSLPQAVIDEIAGMSGTHAIMPSMEPGKKLWGTVLNEYVSLAVDEAVKQTQGNKLTVGGLKKQEALEQIKELMMTNFGIDSGDVKVLNGELELNRRLRVGASALDITNIHGFIQGVGGVLGHDFSNAMDGMKVAGANAVRYANVGVGKADVYDWENGIGFVDESRKGLVTYGWKEVDMVATRANQMLGKGNAVTGWLEGHIKSVAAAQTDGVAQIGSGLYRTVTDRRDFVPDKGDVVIKTTGSAFGVQDPLGRETGRITDKGVHEISMHALNPLPKVTARNTLPIAEDYAGTILDFGRAKGHFGEDGPSFEEVIRKNNGTALLEMPETGPGSGFIKDHVRLVDFGDVTRGGSATNPILREIQKTQQQLWRNIQLYQNIGKNEELTKDEAIVKAGEIKGKINDLIVEYEDKAARMFTNARDGGFHKMFQSADMSMAGRFRIQGVNPMENYAQQADGTFKQVGNYQEGSIYMSRDRLKEMITDSRGRATSATENIAKAMGIMEDGLEGEALVNKVLDNVNDKGLYGLVNRYPTIKQSTVQAMKFQIDDAIDPSDRTARLTVGTAQRLKADYDGDFMSAVLAHYGTDQAETVHKGLADLAEFERIDSIKKGQETAAEIHGDIGNIAKQYNMTVSDIVKEFDIARNVAVGDRDKKQSAIVNAFTIHNRKTMMDALETQEARLGKEAVGFVDNTRFKVDSYMGYVTDLLEQNGKVTSEQAANARNIVQEVMAGFSQDSISAKKFDYDKAFARISASNPNADQSTLTRLTNEDITNRYVHLLDMDAAIKNLTPENKQAFIDKNKIVGIYEGEESEKKMMQALDTLQEYQKYGAKVGGVNNLSLKTPVSEGLNADQAREFFNGTGAPIYGVDSVKAVMDVAPNDEVRSMIRNRINRTENTILQTYDDLANSPESALVDSLGKRAFNADDHMLSGATVADRASSGLGAMVSKFTPKMMHAPSFGGGAIAFGAMWAASALVRSGPTPEGLQEQAPAPAPPPPNLGQAPTARVSENNGEYVNIRVNAKAAKGMSEQDVAALVHQELGSMTSMKMDTTLNVNDNTQNIDSQWLQGVVANAINKGFAF